MRTYLPQLIATLLLMVILAAQSSQANSAPRPQPVSFGGGCDLVDVESIDFEHFRQGLYLRITGLKHIANMRVELAHTPLGSGLWRTEVVGCTGAFGLPIQAPYNVLLPVADLPGARGIEVVGSNGVWRYRVPR